MNWTCLVYGAPMLYAVVWWIVSARHWFHGPKVNIEHQMLRREENIIHGKDGSNDSGDSSANSFTQETRDLSDSKAADLA